MSDDQFCPDCGITNDLHDVDDPDSCVDAEERAEAIERIERQMFGWAVR